MTHTWLESDLSLGDVEQMGFTCKIVNPMPLSSMPLVRRMEYVYYKNENSTDFIKIHTTGIRVQRVYFVLNSCNIKGELRLPNKTLLFETLAEQNYPEAISYMRKHYIDLALENISTL